MKTRILLLFAALLCNGMLSARKKSKPQIPIVAWYSIPAGEYSTIQHYRELRDAGFTISFTHTSTMEEAMQALDMCQRVGIKSIFTCKELHQAPEETVRRVMSHPALGYYFLSDEPQNNDLPDLGRWASRVQSVDSIHPCYMNLLPSWVFTPETYAEHLRLFNEQVNLPQMSFDHYPIRQEENATPTVNPTYYENLEFFRREAQRVGKPFWAFTLSTAHTPYPIPTLGHMRMQLYSDLAYGAQVLQYFTYWNPPTDIWNFHEAPIKADGKRSAVYKLVRTLNQEIQRQAEVWLGCSVKDVAHLGTDIPSGTHSLAALPQHFTRIELLRGSALLSQIENNGKHYVMLLNTSPTIDSHISIEADKSVQLRRKNGILVPAHSLGNTLILSPGDCIVYVVE